MLNEETYRQLVGMRLHGFASAFREYMDNPVDNTLSFDERFGLMADREWNMRQERSLKTRLYHSKLREMACIEDINYKHPRGLDRSVVQRLATCQWIRQHENLLITGASGLGKTWLACALAHKACRDGFSSLYMRVPRLLQDMLVAKGTGTYHKLMERLAKPDVLILDDFALSVLADAERRDFLEVVEDRHARRSTIVTSQLEVKHWHEVIGEPTIADAILDRLLSSSHRVEMHGKTSVRPRIEEKKDKG